jgi:hypothetical protein
MAMQPPRSGGMTTLEEHAAIRKIATSAEKD